MSVLTYLWSEWTLFLIVILFSFYKWSTATYDYFEKRNIPYLKPFPLLGNFGKMLFQIEPFFDTAKRIYFHFNDKKIYGIFELRTPQLVIKDPELIKKITVKDFDHFVNHKAFIEEQDEPIFGNSLFLLKDQKWKDMRSTLSPAFTGSKMRLMFELVEDTCKTVIGHLKKNSKQGSFDIELKDFFTHYTNDVIATTAFGLKIDSLAEKDNYFYKMGKNVANFSGWTTIKLFLFTNFRGMMNFFKFRLFDNHCTQYFHSLVIDTMKYRNKHNIIRPDMINLLMEARQANLKSTSNPQEDSNGFTTVVDKNNSKTNNRIWTDTEIVAQCFLFFLAGFETASALMCLCAHELMENPDIQERLFQEIDEVKRDLNEKPLTYEVLQKMKYLEMVTSETLRKWPPVVELNRVCVKQYTLTDDSTGNKILIQPDSIISIPVVGIHRDPKYYPKPEKFDPERFNDENKEKINPFNYMPFGSGPRLCIASRLALMECKAIIFNLLSEFKLEASSKSSIPLKLAPAGFVLRPKNGFWINLKPRN